jgi:hypothetical protein
VIDIVLPSLMRYVCYSCVVLCYLTLLFDYYYCAPVIPRLLCVPVICYWYCCYCVCVLKLLLIQYCDAIV